MGRSCIPSSSVTRPAVEMCRCLKPDWQQMRALFSMNPWSQAAKARLLAPEYGLRGLRHQQQEVQKMQCAAQPPRCSTWVRGVSVPRLAY